MFIGIIDIINETMCILIFDIVKLNIRCRIDCDLLANIDE